MVVFTRPGRCVWMVLLCGAYWLAPCGASRGGDSWPQFRGPDGQGHADGSGLPLTWSETQNVVWKAPIPGLGWSSPVIQGNQIWLTTAADDGKSLRVVCLDRNSGSVIHDVEAFGFGDSQKVHSKNSHASPTPILDGTRVYVHFGTFGTACLSTAGDVLWRTNALEYDHRHGPGGSPHLVGDVLVITCDGYETQFVAALDKDTGELRWRRDREGQQAYVTPLSIEVDGRTQVVCPGGDAAMAYDAETGDEVWRVRYPGGFSLIPRPIVAHGMVYICTGWSSPTLMAVRLGGQGDVTETHVAWILKQGVPNSPSPVIVGDELYMISDKGVATCVDAKTGEEVWQGRVGGNYSASPIVADGRIYFTSEEGMTTVARLGRTFEVLAKNQIEGRTLASIAVAGNALFLRSDTHLYRIE